MIHHQKETLWYSINLDDSTSDYYESSEEAVNSKTLYLVERSPDGESISGKTNYYKYQFYSPEGENIYPAIGDCKVSGIATEYWYTYDNIGNTILSCKNKEKLTLNHLPVSEFQGGNTFCSITITDNMGEPRTIYISNFKENFFSIIKEISRAESWDSFISMKYFTFLKEKSKDVKTQVTKFGYSKKEYAYEYCKGVNLDTSSTLIFFKRDFNNLNKGFTAFLEIADANFITNEKHQLEYLAKDLKYIELIINGDKPWRE